MPTGDEYQTAIRKLKWPGLKKLLGHILEGTVEAWWEPGKALEYLVMRMFELDGAEVRYPYTVHLLGSQETEQIDGSMRVGNLYFVIECKDEDANIAIDPIAKMRNQLLRRPWGTVGLVFTTTKFTQPAVLMTHFALPQPILLWTRAEISCAVDQKKICEFALRKYCICVEEGEVAFDITNP